MPSARCFFSRTRTPTQRSSAHRSLWGETEFSSSLLEMARSFLTWASRRSLTFLIFEYHHSNLPQRRMVREEETETSRRNLSLLPLKLEEAVSDLWRFQPSRKSQSESSNRAAEKNPLKFACRFDVHRTSPSLLFPAKSKFIPVFSPSYDMIPYSTRYL